MFIKKITQVSLVCLTCLVSSFGMASSDVQDNEKTLSGTLLNSDLKPTDLRVFGHKDNSNIIYVFSSLSCPHCTIFHKKVMPELLNDFVKTNQAKLVYVEMPYDAKAMTGTLYSRCLNTNNYEMFMDKMFQNQDVWWNDAKPRQVMLNYALDLGENKEALESCVANVQLRKTITNQRNNLSELYNITGMPSVVVVTKQSHKKFIGTDKEVILRGIQSKLEVK